MSLGVGSFAASGGSGKLLPSKAYLDTGGKGGSQSGNISFTGVGFGTAHAQRTIIVAVSYYGAATISVPKIGGITADIIYTDTNHSFFRNVFFAAKVPTGASGSVTFTLSAGVSAIVMGVWSALDLDSHFPTQVKSAKSANTLAVSINRPANGFLIGFRTTGYGATPGDTSWGGATKDFATRIATQREGSGASSAASISAATGVSVSSTLNYSDAVMTVLAFGNGS